MKEKPRGGKNIYTPEAIVRYNYKTTFSLWEALHHVGNKRFLLSFLKGQKFQFYVSFCVCELCLWPYPQRYVQLSKEEYKYIHLYKNYFIRIIILLPSVDESMPCLHCCILGFSIIESTIKNWAVTYDKYVISLLLL